MWFWICCRDPFDAPICIVDGEKRIYMSTHKYSIVEPAPVSYLFEEIDKTLNAYEALLKNPDPAKRQELKQKWIHTKKRIRTYYTKDCESMKKLAEKQLEYRRIDAAWKNTI